MSSISILLEDQPNGTFLASILGLPECQAEGATAGTFQNDPQWDEFQAAIAEYRRELDAKLAAEYQQIDETFSLVQSPPFEGGFRGITMCSN